MKYILTIPRGNRIELNELETKIKNARSSNDYILINFGTKGQFIKLAFCKDQTYCIGYNFWNMEFSVKTNIMLKQYPKTNTLKLAQYLFNWVNKLNR